VGRVVERLPRTTFQSERARLETLARDLGAMRASANIGAALEIGAGGWSAHFDAIIAEIAPRERQTYFNEATLGAALSRD
jgi:hypothetical protein